MEIARIEEAKRWILTGAAQDGLGLRFMRGQSRGEKAIHVSRHHHPFQQIRWAEKGTRNIGPDQYIRERDIAYFPRRTYYGPETLGDTAFAAITLQFGFGPEYRPMREEIKWSMSRKGADRAAVSAMLAARRKTEGGGEPTVTHYATSERDTRSEEGRVARDAEAGCWARLRCTPDSRGRLCGANCYASAGLPLLPGGARSRHQMHRALLRSPRSNQLDPIVRSARLPESHQNQDGPPGTL